MGNLEQFFVMLTAVAGSTALWKFFETRLKMKTDRQKEKEQNSDSSQYRQDLKARVEKMSQDLEEAQEKILQLTEEVAALRVENTYLKKEIERLKDK